MKKYKIRYNGLMYVEADNEDEAMELAQEGITIYEELEYDSIEEMDEFDVWI